MKRALLASVVATVLLAWGSPDQGKEIPVMKMVSTVSVVSALLLVPGLALGAFDDRLDTDRGRTLQGVELIPRMHPVRDEPEVHVGADSERMKAGEKVRSHFGRIASLPNGDLIVAYNERETGSHSHDPTNHCLVRTSGDGGYTWDLPVVMDNEIRDRASKGWHLDNMHHGLTVLSDGTVWLAPARLDDDKYHVPRGTDGGKTWDFDLIAPAYMRYFHQMSNGEIIGVGASPKVEGLRSGRAVFITDTTAQKWERVDLGAQSGHEVDEACIVETGKPGELYILMRDQDRAHYYYNAWSPDFGRTWEGYAPSGVWYSLRPSMPFVTRTDDGILLALNSERSNGRIVVTPSFDGGRTWDLGRRIFVLDAPAPGSLGGSHGYCSMASSGGDNWFGVWYDARQFSGCSIDLGYIRRPFAGLRLAAGAAIDDPRPIARWSFEGKERNWMIGQPNRDDGKANLVARVDGRVGRAIRFNGNNSEVIVRDTPSVRVPSFFTIECWFRADRVEGEQALIAKRPYYYLGLAGDKITFQLGPPPGENPPRQVFRVDTEQAIEAGRWYHVAATVGTPYSSYKGARVYLDGKPAAFLDLTKDGMGRDWSFNQAAYYLDARPEKGPAFMNYGKYKGYQVDPSAHLYFGVDNMTGQAHFQGSLDEVRLHGRCLAFAEIEKLAQSGYARSGSVTTDPIPLDGNGWGVFQAETDTPEGTAIKYAVLDANAEKVLRDNVKPGDSLHEIKDQTIRLQAELSTTNPSVSPVLKTWAITGTTDD